MEIINKLLSHPATPWILAVVGLSVIGVALLLFFVWEMWKVHDILSKGEDDGEF